MAGKDKNEKEMTPEEESAETVSPNAAPLLARQSAPRQNAMDYIKKQRESMLASQGVDASTGALNGMRAARMPVSENELHKATQTLMKYKSGKANLEKRIIDNEQWYKMRHWECMRDKKDDVQPASGWLFNCIANKHADMMDNFPSPNVLPREDGDKAEAEMLTSIIPVILDQNGFEDVYDSVCHYKLKTGTGVYGIYWDSSRLNGLGDVVVKKIDILSLFWEPGVTDIQNSKNVFHVELMDNESIEQMYPQTVGRLGQGGVTVSEYVHDESIDTSDKSLIIDWYYKRNVGGRTVLHYCKYVNDVVLFATENDPKYYSAGLYDHGKYPFIFDVLFPVEGMPTGFGYIDVGKDAQAYIDRGNSAILKSMLANARPRIFLRSDGSINEKEYSDLTNDIVHVDGNLGQDSIMPIQSTPLSDIYVKIIDEKVNELKETTGNRDISTGGTASGVTAASAIAAMQEAGSKLSRDANKASYRAFREVCLIIIELIRQFYDMPRCFRIMGENGTARFVSYSNQGLAPKPQGNDFGIDTGMRIPLFDIEVSAQKASPYSKMSQNELALQFFGAGFFNPQLSDQALACLDMMDFDRKQFIMQKIAQNGTMYQQMMLMQQQMMSLAAMVDQYRGGSEISDSLAAQFGVPPSPMGGSVKKAKDSADGGESSVTKNARERAAESTSPT